MKKKAVVDVIEKVHTSYRSTRPGKTSDEDLLETSDAEQVTIDKRHYCRHCKRKRDESFMRIVGHGAFGKKSWACSDDEKVCLAIRKLKYGF